MIKGLTLRHVYIANAALVGVLLSVGLGFFLGREFPAAPAANPPPRPQLPPGVTQLPQANFQAWALNCLQNAQGNKRCQLTMRAFDPKQKGVVLQLVAARGGNGRPFLAIMTPSNAALPPGVRLALGNQGATIPFRNCTPQACQAITPLDGNLLYLLNTTPQVQVGYNVASGQPVNYQLPTAGFNQAYAAWSGAEQGLGPIPTEAPAPANAAPGAKPGVPAAGAKAGAPAAAAAKAPPPAAAAGGAAAAAK